MNHGDTEAERVNGIWGKHIRLTGEAVFMY
jgi:hypothetical protein